MTQYGKPLAHQSSDLFLTDGGLETTLIFQQQIDLPEFAAFPLLSSNKGKDVLSQYFHSYAQLANKHRCHLILESPTWRASEDWGKKLNFDAAQLNAINHQAIDLLVQVRKEYDTNASYILISGCIGPRNDGYHPDSFMSAAQAKQYHQTQIDSFADTQADLITAMTITYPDEAIGIVLAAKEAKLPVVISFTVETDGHLPDGTSLQEAIAQVDLVTANYSSYYMVNCAHPTHFLAQLDNNHALKRLRGVRANASCLSHAELDEMEILDDGDPIDFGNQYQQIKQRLPHLNVVGGCCGTDQRHIEAIASTLNH